MDRSACRISEAPWTSAHHLSAEEFLEYPVLVPVEIQLPIRDTDCKRRRTHRQSQNYKSRQDQW